jgi:hypothetical protein
LAKALPKDQVIFDKTSLISADFTYIMVVARWYIYVHTYKNSQFFIYFESPQIGKKLYFGDIWYILW